MGTRGGVAVRQLVPPRRPDSDPDSRTSPASSGRSPNARLGCPPDHPPERPALAQTLRRAVRGPSFVRGCALNDEGPIPDRGLPQPHCPGSSGTQVLSTSRIGGAAPDARGVAVRGAVARAESCAYQPWARRYSRGVERPEGRRDRRVPGLNHRYITVGSSLELRELIPRNLAAGDLGSGNDLTRWSPPTRAGHSSPVGPAPDPRVGSQKPLAR